MALFRKNRIKTYYIQKTEVFVNFVTIILSNFTILIPKILLKFL